MRIKQKRIAGQIMGRDGISARILLLAEDIVSNGGYKNAMKQAGRISVLVDAASFDDYWKSKAFAGSGNESDILDDLINGYFSKDDLCFPEKSGSAVIK